jgi:hypothetical protein
MSRYQFPLVPAFDSRAAEVRRVADFLEAHPGATAKEIDAACDVGCVSKVLSDMHKAMGYRLAFGWRDVVCAAGQRLRRVRTYALVSRPGGTVERAVQRLVCTFFASLVRRFRRGGNQ